MITLVFQRMIWTLCLLLLGSGAHAAWKLEPDHSTVNFVSIKKGAIAETHHFRQMDGSLDDEGKLKITLQLDSIDSKIPVRDERMRKHLFETDKLPTATITAQLDKLPAEAGVSHISNKATLDLHGVSKEIQVELVVMKTDTQLMAATIRPVIINAADFGLADGVAMLQKLANLPSIATAVPVNGVLVFSKQ